MEIKISLDGEGQNLYNPYFGCPLRSDLNTCGVLSKSEINHCPQFVETDNDYYSIAPADCPLRESKIVIKKK